MPTPAYITIGFDFERASSIRKIGPLEVALGKLAMGVRVGGVAASSKRNAPTLYSVKNPLRGIEVVSTSKSVTDCPFTSCVHVVPPSVDL
jgi:hypothetical protein